MIKKLKNKLIKMLGGVPLDEINATPPKVIIKTPEIITIRAEYINNHMGLIPERDIKGLLINELMSQLETLLIFEVSHEMSGKTKYRATAKVVKEVGKQ